MFFRVESIDAFLETRRELLGIGKRVIANANGATGLLTSA